MSAKALRVIFVVFLGLTLTRCSSEQPVGVSGYLPIGKAVEESDLVLLGRLQTKHNVAAIDDSTILLNGDFLVEEVLSGTYKHKSISLLCPYQKSYDTPPQKGELAIFFLDVTNDKSGTTRKILQANAQNINKTRETIKTISEK